MKRLKTWVSRLITNLFTKPTILFIGGLAGVAHETLIEHADRPTLLILFAAMMGLPAFLTTEAFPHETDKDKQKREDEKDQTHDPDSDK